MTIETLPSVNASLNATSAVLLIAGWICVKRAKVNAHIACMISATIVSALFLVSYLIYHAHVGSVPYQGQGWTRPVYFTILISHAILAVVIVPLVLRTIVLAATRRIAAHQRLARVTAPLWLYVSVTGVVVYLMLYRF